MQEGTLPLAQLQQGLVSERPYYALPIWLLDALVEQASETQPRLQKVAAKATLSPERSPLLVFFSCQRLLQATMIATSSEDCLQV